MTKVTLLVKDAPKGSFRSFFFTPCRKVRSSIHTVSAEPAPATEVVRLLIYVDDDDDDVDADDADCQDSIHEPVWPRLACVI